MKFWQSDAFLGPIMVMIAPLLGVLFGLVCWIVFIRNLPELFSLAFEGRKERRQRCQQ